MTRLRGANLYSCEPASAAHTSPCPCAWDGCAGTGEYRAPRDRSLSDYVFFCLEHIRAYNAEWDFHAGLGDADIEKEIRSSATWDRPTWKLGALGGGPRRWTEARIDDPLNLGRDTSFDRTQQRRNAGWSAEEIRALKTLGIEGELTLTVLKARYKILVKKFHPDANGGSAHAERQMKLVNAAFTLLKTSLTNGRQRGL